MQFRKAYISFGANLPFAAKSPEQTILAAMQELDGGDLQWVKQASLWHSPAWPDPNEPQFTNTMALFMSHLSPLKLLNRLAKVEAQFGRKRSIRNAPRTLDLDLISYGELQTDTRRVQLPHPRAGQRAFVLLPLREICPNWTHPETDVKIDDLIIKLPVKDRKTTIICKTV